MSTGLIDSDGNRRNIDHATIVNHQQPLPDYGDGESVDVDELFPLLRRLERLEDELEDGEARRRVTEIRADLGKAMLDEMI